MNVFLVKENFQLGQYNSTFSRASFTTFVQAAEGATNGDENTPPVPASMYSKNEAPAQLVLCADTIGQVSDSLVQEVRIAGWQAQA